MKKGFEIKNNGKVFFKEVKHKKLVKRHRNTLFKTRKGKKRTTVVQKVKRRRVFRVFSLIIFLLVMLAVVSFGVYFAIKSVIDLRNKTEEDVQIGNVYGLDAVPEYPSSEFIFKDDLQNESVKNFLSLGNSVYRIMDDSSILDVFAYYKVELEKLGWAYKLSVPVDSEEMLYGEYWTKESKGLRIYSRLNDIWYQTITTKQAESGMKDVVERDTARKLLLLTTEKEELLPNFPWTLAFPSEYIPNYHATNLTGFQGVSFKKIGSSDEVLIEPVGYFGAMDYDAFISKFLKAYNKANKTKWSVVNSKETETAGETSVTAIITYKQVEGRVVVVKNISNTIVYTLVSFKTPDAFFDYVLTHIKPVAITSD